MRRLFLYIAPIILVVITLLPKFAENLASLRIVRELQPGDAISNLTNDVSLASPYLQGVLALDTDPRRAEQLFERALSTRHYAIARNRLMDAWLRQGDVARALQYLNSPGLFDDAYLTKVSEWLIPRLGEADRLAWRQMTLVRQPHKYVWYAHQLINAQKFVEAEDWLRAAPFLNQSEVGLIQLGKSLFYQGAVVQAAATLKESYSRKPDASAELAYWYGRSLLVSGNAQSSIEPLERSVRLAADSERAWYLDVLSQAYLAVGRCKDAERTLDKALQLKLESNVLDQLRKSKAALPACNS